MQRNKVFTKVSNTSIKEREITIDILKGIAIILVVLGHVICGIYDTEHFQENIIFKICYSFHMPLFVFVSGYLNGLKPSKKIDIIWLKNRTLRLMIPYFIWSIGKWFLYRESLVSLTNSLFVDPLYWFIIFIYICSVFVFLANAIKRPYLCMIAAYGLIIIVGVIWPDNLLVRNLKQFYPFYMLGFFGSRFKNFFKKYNYLQKYGWISLILYPLSMFIYSYGGEELKIHSVAQFLHLESIEQYLTILWKMFNKYGVAILGIWFMFTIANWMVRKEKCKIIQKSMAFVGLYTIQVYLLHDFFYIRRFGHALLNTIASFVVSLSISLIISQIVKRCPKLNKILFGQ